MAVKSIRLLSDGFFTIDKGLLIYGKTQYYGQKYRAALKPLLIDCDDHWILVDTGMGKVNEKYAKFYHLERAVTLEDSLQSVGLCPKDISVVINTHLHFDHCGNNVLFSDAEFIVQEEELKYARNPHRFQKNGYLTQQFDIVEYTTVRGEKTVCDGVRIVPTPGHTPGHQSVLIDLDDKKYIYCGDVAPVKENLEERNIVGILHNPVQALESIDKLLSLKGIYIFCHDNEQTSL